MKAAEAESRAINRLVAEDALELEVEKLAHAIAENAPLSLKAGKLAINHAAGYGFAGGMDAVQEAANRCFDSTDYREGRAAFLEKRKAQFRGRIAAASRAPATSRLNWNLKTLLPAKILIFSRNLNFSFN